MSQREPERDERWEDWLENDLADVLGETPESRAIADAMAEAMRTPLAPGDPRRHHYVPQFYLRRFARNDDLWRVRFDDPSAPTPVVVKDAAVIKDFYTTVDVDIGETVAVERVLALLDGEASGAVARLAFGVLFPPQLQDRLNLALWISMLCVRGPQHRRQMEAMADHAFKMHLSLIHNEDQAREHLRSDGVAPSDAEVQELLEAVEQMDSWEISPHQNDLVQMMLRLALHSTRYILGRYWTLLRFPEPGLVLTDKPLVMYQSPEKRSSWFGVGLATADELWLPLDRRTALILHNEEVVGERIIKAPPDHSVDDFNQAVVSQAYAELYCHPDDLDRVNTLTLPDPSAPIMRVSGADWVKGKTDGVNEPPRRRGHHRYRRRSLEDLAQDD